MKRQSNIELLRIFAIIGVVFLHYYNSSIGGASVLVEYNSVNFFVLNFFESTCICAVNIFVLICGYFLSRTYSRNLIKPIQLAIQVVAINVGYYLLCAIRVRDFDIKELLYSFVPSNWFLILYIVLFVFSPYINIVMETLSIKKFKQLIVLSLVVFSVVPTFFDLFAEIFNRNFQISPIGIQGNQEGYTIVNFILMYLIGGFLAKCDLGRIKAKTIVMLLVFNIVVIFAFLYIDKKVALEYCNPFVISEAVLFFLLSSKMQVKTNRFINAMAKGTFSVFLLHFYFYDFINIGYFVHQNAAILVAHVIISSCIIYLSCWVLGYIYEKVTTPAYKCISRKYPALVWNLREENRTKPR